jgi:hypothetical protein
VLLEAQRVHFAGSWGGVKWKRAGGEEGELTSWEISRSGWLSEEWMQGEDDDRERDEGDGREVASAPAGGGETAGRVRGRVVAGGQAAVDVLAGGERHVAAGRVFVEPEPPVAHVEGGGRGRRRAGAERHSPRISTLGLKNEARSNSTT